MALVRAASAEGNDCRLDIKRKGGERTGRVDEHRKRKGKKRIDLLLHAFRIYPYSWILYVVLGSR